MEKKSLKIAFFSPYLPDHLGGGEKHLLDVASVCVAQGAQVSLCLPSGLSDAEISTTQKRLAASFGVSTGQFRWPPSPLFESGFSWKKLSWTKQFDVLYYVTDGSLFFSLAKDNILHLQIPFTDPLAGVVNRVKLRNWQKIQTNSEFTKSVIEKSWRCRVDQVIYPLVDEQLFQLPRKKEKIMLSVGRFFRQLHSKRQDVLVTAFKKLLQRTPESLGWRLVLLGSVEDEHYFGEVRQLARGLPVTFVTNATRSTVLDWYQKASLYWHATGFEQNEKKHPEKVEHFGISTVEAMASGAVPLAVGSGGQKEILSGELLDLQWQSIDELLQKTTTLLRNSASLHKFQRLCQLRARDFDQQHFEVAVRQLFDWKAAS